MSMKHVDGLLHLLSEISEVMNVIYIYDECDAGKEIVPSGIYSFVDVRDVVDAHIQAFELPSANGRYCLVGTTMHSSRALKIIGDLYPSLHFPQK